MYSIILYILLLIGILEHLFIIFHIFTVTENPEKFPLHMETVILNIITIILIWLKYKIHFYNWFVLIAYTIIFLLICIHNIFRAGSEPA